ncbi:gamma-glutamylcyclotransferase family protein [Flagellimonas sp.]|uniref:gamma-glutamylcyclotransferase family protein n=1 Tax=Flagellimonas sp. TaxID=2058762 RepID=UPI003BADAC2B
MKELLFSYGTLQLKKVQLESFGRELNGAEDALKGYKLEQLEITNKAVLDKSQQNFHPIAVPTQDPNDQIIGTLYEISKEELKQADLYEVNDYKRVKATFHSGKQGWVYVKS